MKKELAVLKESLESFTQASVVNELKKLCCMLPDHCQNPKRFEALEILGFAECVPRQET